MAAATLRSPVTPGLTIKTDFEGCDSFPTYIDPFEDSDETFIDEASMPSSSSSSPLNPSQRLVEKVREDPSRHASPQPTSVHVPTLSGLNGSNGVGGNGYRVMRSATVGYIAPEFKGKSDQMKQGEQQLSFLHLASSLSC
jgi:glutamate dehydrogenase